ncbi:MAG: glutamate racemase [Anaerolineaceae bacterium]|nr:glutamate racemase [Anaerolineaceae bacterium]
MPPDKIGVLDSGVGGLSVLREIHALLPDYPTLYFADQAHLPYGPRPPAEVRSYVSAIADFLIDRGAAVIVVACNAASAASLYDLRAQYPGIPFVGMEPAVKPAATATQSGVIGVLTTQATASGPLYARVLEQHTKHVRVITQVAPELVMIAETNSQHTPESREIIAHHLQPMLDAGADQIVLACTHFPFLTEAIQAIVGDRAQLINPSPAVARQTARVWPSGTPPTMSENRYFTSGNPAQFLTMLRNLTGVNAPVEQATWQADSMPPSLFKTSERQNASHHQSTHDN